MCTSMVSIWTLTSSSCVAFKESNFNSDTRVLMLFVSSTKTVHLSWLRRKGTGCSGVGIKKTLKNYLGLFLRCWKYYTKNLLWYADPGHLNKTNTWFQKKKSSCAFFRKKYFMADLKLTVFVRFTVITRNASSIQKLSWHPQGLLGFNISCFYLWFFSQMISPFVFSTCLDFVIIVLIFSLEKVTAKQWCFKSFIWIPRVQFLCRAQLFLAKIMLQVC